MNVELRLPAALAALVLLPLSPRASEPIIPLLRIGEPEWATDDAPPVSLVIPDYTLTSREQQIVAACLVLEAANQGEFGMRSVMAVIRNRARGLPVLFPSTVLRRKQFSALNKLTSGRESIDKTLARAQSDRMWPTALAIVDEAAHDRWHDPTGGATHFTRAGERNPWTGRLAKTVTIGGHSFYR